MNPTPQEIPTCQAFRIHENWFATAAHCVDMCVFDKQCNIRLLLASGPVSAYAQIAGNDIFIPKDFRTTDSTGQVREQKTWDIALLRYRPGEYLYEFDDGTQASAEDFEQALKESRALRMQWKGTVRPEIPVLYSYSGKDVMNFAGNLRVALWTFEDFKAFSNPHTVLYFGQKKSLWAADGFGVDHGNSGGAVVADDGGILGIATAKMDNNLPADVRQIFPQFGQAREFFLFNGFAPDTTLKFIQQVMGRFGDRPRVKKLRHIKPPQPPTTLVP